MSTLIVSFITMMLVISFYCGGLWIAGSFVTSGVKAVSNNCKQVYPVEKVLSGNWFCPTKKQ
jgi:hypothetical protein